MHIESYDDLNKWLEENYYFENGHILSVEQNPLAIVVGYNVKGNYKAHSEWHILAYRIAPNGLLNPQGSFDVMPAEEYYIDGIDPIKVEEGIGLEFCASSMFSLISQSLLISDPMLIKTTFKPWMHPTEIQITAPTEEIPKPSFWREKFLDRGIDIVFRYYSGEAKNSSEVPYPNYGGYFIQLSTRIEETREGILIDKIELINHEMRASFSNKDPHLQNAWIFLTSIIADIQNVKITCGNCEFTGEEWKQILQENRYPPQREENTGIRKWVREVELNGRLGRETYYNL